MQACGISRPTVGSVNFMHMAVAQTMQRCCLVSEQMNALLKMQVVAAVVESAGSFRSNVCGCAGKSVLCPQPCSTYLFMQQVVGGPLRVSASARCTGCSALCSATYQRNLHVMCAGCASV
jgi:hypothetical protein